MLLSVMVVGTGAAFSDQSSIKNTEAVDACVALNIIAGMEDGSYRPANNVTRAQMCKMICVALNGGKEPTEEDKSIDSPYNTYLYKGLPPTPIANPGMESIVAAMNPSDSKDFYYALGDDNTHHFFRTYDQLQKFTASQDRYQS